MYTLSSLTGSSHVKYEGSSLSCKKQENQHVTFIFKNTSLLPKYLPLYKCMANSQGYSARHLALGSQHLKCMPTGHLKVTKGTPLVFYMAIPHHTIESVGR